MKNYRKILSLGLLIIIQALSGCATKKALLKTGEVQVPQKDQDLALKLFKEGSELLMVDNKAALAKFKNALEHDTSLVAAYYNSGVALEALGDFNQAAQYYESCLAIDKEQPSCLENLLLVKHKLGEEQAALSLIDSYVRDFPDAPFVNVARAKLAFVQKDLDQAERYARQAIERDAENIEALYLMGRIFFERKAYKAAKWVIKNALELAPSHGGLHMLLGHTNKALDLEADALDNYAAAVKYHPSEEALESYGLMLLRRGRVEESLPILIKLSEQWPLEYRHFLHLGNAYMAHKQFEKARAAYLKVQELSPNDHDVLFNLGLLYLDMKPENMSELERLTTSESYFKQYLTEPGLSQERVNEVNAYLTGLERKIEIAKSASEPTPVEQAPEEQQEKPAEEVP